MSKIIKDDCQIVQELLLNREIGELLNSEQKQLKSHLEICQICRNFQKNLSQLQTAMIIDEESKLKPRPTTRKYLISRIRNIHKKPIAVHQSILEKIRIIFGYRIPVYQAILATVFAVLFILLLSQSYFQQKAMDYQEVLSTVQDSGDLGFLDIRVNLNFLDEEKMGRNLKEDSILARYIIKSL